MLILVESQLEMDSDKEEMVVSKEEEVDPQLKELHCLLETWDSELLTCP